MAIPTPVNGQITDAVTQSNVKVLGDAPAMSMGAIYQSLAHSTGILYENATSSQQQLAIAAQAATNQGVIQVYSLDTMAAAVATSKVAQSDVPDTLLALLAALRGSTAPLVS
jgi:Killing trait